MKNGNGIILDFYGESLNRQTEVVAEAYDPDKMFGIAEEAGRAIEKIHTVYLAESMRIQSEVNSGKKDVILVAEGLFEKGGFFSNIWETIVKAFRTVADFVGNLFNKLTGATEKNLKALKDAWILLETDDKYKKLLNSADNTVSLKKDSFVKIPKNAVATPLVIATKEGNSAIKDMATTELQSLEIAKVKIYDLFNTKLSAAATALNSTDSFNKGSFGGDAIVKDVQAISASNLRPMAEPDKAVKKTIASFIKHILGAAAGSGKVADDIIDRSTMLEFDWNVAGHGVVNTSAKVAEMFKSSYNSENANDNEFRSVFGCLGALKNINKPEDVADIKNLVVDACKIEGEIRVEGDKIKALMGYMSSLYYATIDGKYDNLVKFFKDGKEKFTLLAEKYEDIAKEFKGAVNSAANNNGSNPTTNEQNARTAASSLSSLVADTGDISKFTMFFSQLSLKWYSVVDGLLGVGVTNFYNLIKIVKDSLDKNTVEIV